MRKPRTAFEGIGVHPIDGPCVCPLKIFCEHGVTPIKESPGCSVARVECGACGITWKRIVYSAEAA